MNKRKQERYVPATLIEAVNTVTDTPLGTLANISLGGFLLTSQIDEIPEGAIYQFKLQECNEPVSMEPIHLGAVCLWHSDASSPGSYWSGFQILDISPEQEQLLKSYIASLHS